MSVNTLTALTSAPNLDFYRKQAKALVRSVSSADASAVARVRQLLPHYCSGDPFLLSDAHWILAREYGFQSWTLFKLAVEERAQRQEQLGDAATDSGGYVPSMKSEAVAAKTGKGWDAWFSVLDAAGCAKMSHKEIVSVAREHGAGSWWQQMVTVEYERARGLRVKNQSCAGDHQMNSNKTINAPAEAVFAAWADPEKRELWLPGSGLTVRKATCPKSLRITWSDGTNLDVMIYPKGDAKCSCSAEHSKLKGADQVEPLKAYWTAALARLKELVEA